MKKVTDGLSKQFQVNRTSKPFFKGGKIDLANDEKNAVCLYENQVKIVNVESGDVTSDVSPTSDSEEIITCFCLHPNNSEIVVATHKHFVRHWNIEDKVCLRVFRAHQMPILAMTFDVSGTLVATASADRSVKVWDIYRGFCTHHFKYHTDIIQTIQFHPDPSRNWLFSCGDDTTICVSDLITSQLVTSLTHHVSTPTQVAVSPNGKHMASSGRDKVLIFYAISKTTVTHLKTVPIMEELESVIILNSTDSQGFLKNEIVNEKRSLFIVVAGGQNGILHFYKVEGTSTELIVTPLLDVPLYFDAGLHESKRIGSTEDLKRILNIRYLPQSHAFLTVTNDYNLATYTIDQVTHGLHSDDDAFLYPSRLLIGSHGEILDMAVFPGSSRESFQIALVSNSNQVRVVDEHFSCKVLDGHTDIVLSIDISPDGKWLVTSSKDQTCILWSVERMGIAAIATGHADAVGSVAISRTIAPYTSNGNAFFVSGGGDKILKKWSVPMKTINLSKSSTVVVSKLVAICSIHAHDKDINSVDIAPNDTMIASGSQDKSVKLWNAADLTLIATLNGHKRGIWKVLFSSIDKVLASSSGDRTVRLWSLVDYSTLRTFEGNTASVLSISFVNYSTQLLSGSADGLIRLWNVRTGECVNTFDMHEDKVWTLAACAIKSTKLLSEGQGGVEFESHTTENFFFSGGADSQLLVWKDTTEEENLNQAVLAETQIALEQQLAVDLRNKDYHKALLGALNLGHSMKTMGILQTILETEKEGEEEVVVEVEQSSGDAKGLFRQVWSRRLDPYVSQLTNEQIEKILGYLKDWNTNARYCYVSQVLINTLTRVIKIDRLMTLKSFAEVIPGILSYSERHFQRLDRLRQASHMIDYTSSLIGQLVENNAFDNQ